MKCLIIIILSLSFISVQAQQRKLQVEPNHSTVGFDKSIAGFSIVTGKFTDFQIYVDWDDTNMIATNMYAEIKASSINTGILDRDTHYKSLFAVQYNEQDNLRFPKQKKHLKVAPPSRYEDDAFIS